MLDLSRLVAGNIMTHVLAELGAEVIEIEKPTGDDLRNWTTGNQSGRIPADRRDHRAHRQSMQHSGVRDVYATSDGRYVALSSGTQAMAERLLRVIGRAALVDDRFRTNADRLARREEIEAIVRHFIATRTQAETLAFFEAAGVTVGPTCNEADLAEHPYVREREVLVDLPDRVMARIPMHNVRPRLSGTPGALRRPAPALGQHSAEMLRELGYTEAEMEALMVGRAQEPQIGAR